MAELADALDSGSSGHYVRAGSSPVIRIQKKDHRRNDGLFLRQLLFFCKALLYFCADFSWFFAKSRRQLQIEEGFRLFQIPLFCLRNVFSHTGVFFDLPVERFHQL